MLDVDICLGITWRAIQTNIHIDFDTVKLAIIGINTTLSLKLIYFLSKLYIWR